ncbi:MAG: ferrochelatase [Lautropia sp.]|nr:ferrochelatase [Lautropia sp.]
MTNQAAPQRADFSPRAAVLLVQLGTPDTPEPADVRSYLREFLSDPRVIELPRALWLPILYGGVLTRRPKESAEKYQKIWREDGSPLSVFTRRQAEDLQDELKKRGRLVEVAWAMRYGNPSLPQALRDLRDKGIQRLVVLPLYPQYSGSTTGSVFDAVAREFKTWRRVPNLRFVQDFHDDPGYIEALADSIRQRWRNEGGDRPEKLVFSFHGLPQRYVDGGDPYDEQCRRTAALVAESLGLNEAQWVISYQSLFGKTEWIKPYTQPTVEALARQGVKTIDVICPGFVSDCIETLEEIDMEVHNAFMRAGGQRFRFIDCLNDSPLWIHALADMVGNEVSGWGTREIDAARARR